MSTIFSKIIAGEIPSRRLTEDDVCISFLDVRPLAPGHALVVPREEVDHWNDLSTAVAGHLMTVAHIVGRAQRAVFNPARVGLMIAGFEVPHTHLHVFPAQTMSDFSFANADTSPDAAQMDIHARDLRGALQSLGCDFVVAD